LAIESVMKQLRGKRLCLFLDIDGTLLEFAAHPDAVYVPPQLVADLRDAYGIFEAAIAFVSGRPVQQIDALFHPLRFSAAGVHGAEIRLTPDGEVMQTKDAGLSPALWLDVVQIVGRFPGTLAENKTFGYAVHYRNAPQFGPAVTEEIERLITAAQDPTLSLLHGHGVVEIKKAKVEKGWAIEVLMQQQCFAGRTPIFIGDDVTDVPAFAKALELGGFAYSVGHRRPDLSGSFENPMEVRAWLANVVHTAEVQP
jgi:trehalose 6-phosphate phosphatase